MIEYAELEERLREYSAARKGEIAELTREAADAIERMAAEIESLYDLLGTHPDPVGEKGEPGWLPDEPEAQKEGTE